MPKNKPTASSRVDEFKREGFYVNDGKILFCKYCNCRLDHERKDTLKKHIISDKHTAAKKSGSNLKRQLSIPESGAVLKRAKEQKENFVLETVEAFTAAGISVEKLDNPNLKTWMEKHVSGSGDLPTADWMRKKYFPLLREKKEAEIKQKLSGNDIVILADETTDKNNNCIFNILFKVLNPGAEEEVILGASCVLDSANAACCSRAVIDVCAKYNVKEENIVAYVTDGARYMTKSAGTLQGVFGDHLYHIQCWAHKVNLVGQIWQSNLDDLNQFVCKVKNAFLNTRKRRHAYLTFLRTKHEENKALVKLFPMPVLTRWNTWFEAVSYLALHLHDVIEFFNELSEENAGVKYVKELQKEEILCLEATLVFVADNCAMFVDLINFLEGSKYPSAHHLTTRLSKLQTTLEVLARGILPEAVETVLSKMKTVKSAALKEQFKQTAKLSLLKLNSLLNSDPSRQLFLGIGALFNPQNTGSMQVEDKELHRHFQNLPFLQKLQKNLLATGFMTLQKLVSEEQKKPNVNHVDMVDILCRMKDDFPEFASAALKLIWIPPTNVDSERSFSKYSVIVSDRRRSLKPENAELLTMVAFD